MKLILAFTAFLSAIALISADLECSIPLDEKAEIPQGWINMTKVCTNALKKQIQTEIGASYEYLEMAAYFSQDIVNRPGFAEHFFKSAREEREHGLKLIEYLTMRGGDLQEGVHKLISVPYKEENYEIKFDGVSALKHAVEMETAVTKSIRALIETCESENNDYHLVDYLTGVYLEEQLKGTRELAGKLTTLKKMQNSHGQLAEFLFDKQLM
ncbi:ferritin subunit [Eupeodes corollae]|uniref:ferritin subunit n=1 Tax=Eupeodes corollae TaxID=290404 RepID=UPI0024924463|nr:ferritin subunit [Eupeodes corollae]